MTRLTRLRLCIMMFLEFFIWGGWFVTLGSYLAANLHASGAQTALAYSTQSWGAIIAPFTNPDVASFKVDAFKGFSPTVPGGALHSLVWGRDTSLENTTAFLHKVDADWLITGHIPCPEGYTTPNSRQLILDAMATPACYCQFSTDQPTTLAELVAGIGVL